MQSSSTIYAGRDLEAMACATNYHDWIMGIFKPFLGRRIVEVGAGIGSFSELFLKDSIESLSLIEPSQNMHHILCERMRKLSAVAQINIYNGLFTEVAREIRINQRPDSIVYVNVLEHIADDESELRSVHETLAPQGRMFIFVPAFQWLFGKFDHHVGHYRRYTTGQLEEYCIRAGFKVLELRYLDLLGIFPWWLKYCLLESSSMESRLVHVYDKFLVPISRFIESRMTPPAGKNVLLIAEKV
jgi:SAM-dependent methyltransferase